MARLLDGLVAAGPYLVFDLLLPGALGEASGALAAAAYILFSDGLTGVRFMHRCVPLRRRPLQIEACDEAGPSAVAQGRARTLP
ncbi:MAG: hypothetical protein BRD46_02095 [Bacteroidetes bacterium QS_8_68_15]|nr:MAG: hypothetical protein BRD46_02095 [Bacteroidetes bacterium QS_8_68_15]